MSSKNIVVLLGGDTGERVVSLRSGQAVLEAVRNLGFSAIPFDPSERSLIDLPSLNPYKVFNCLHGGIGENGVIQGFLESMGIPFTGSKHLACGLSMQKHLCKQLWDSLGLPTIKGATFTKDTPDIIENISNNFIFPIAIKPSNGGSSVAITKVMNQGWIKPAIEKAFLYDNVVVVEEWLSGQEYTIGIIPEMVLPSIRITPHTASGWYDYEAKYESAGTPQATSYELDTLTNTEEQEIQQLAKEAFLALGAENWGRIDLIKLGSQFLLLEANLSPGMTTTSLVPKAASHIGLSFEKLVEKILYDIKV